MPLKFFITHSWKDIDFAQRLGNDLIANGLDGFLDAHSINPGDSIPLRIERGLTDCDVYIPIFSPEALKSDWCDWEIDMAITMNRTLKGRPRIIPVIARPCTVPNRLIHLLHVDFVGRYDVALDELLAKGFGLPNKLPAAIRPSTEPTSSTRRAPLFPVQPWVLAAAGMVFIVALVLVLQLAGSLAGVGSAWQPTRVARSTGTTTILSEPVLSLDATPSRAPAVIPSVTLAPTPTPIFGIGSTKILADGSSMVFVPAGEFLMGSRDDDKDAETNEKPQHTVYLDAFWIGRYPVTNALYKKCVDAGRCFAPAHWSKGAFPSGEENHPVVDVSWNDASAYARWSGGRLPTEAEWEKAACWDEANKAKQVYPWGNKFDGQKSNVLGPGPSPVDKYSPQGDSRYGASDMVGNVWQWMEDWYSATYYSRSPKNSPKGADPGIGRVLRGGSWVLHEGFVRCTYRLAYDPDVHTNDIGFRIAASEP